MESSIASAVKAQGAKDAAAAAQVPSPVPEGWENTQFKTPDLPVDEPFTISILSQGLEYGPFRQDEFTTEPDNITTAHLEDGHPFILRVLDQWAQQDTIAMNCVMDDGTTEMLVVKALRDNTLEIEEPTFGDPAIGEGLL